MHNSTAESGQVSLQDIQSLLFHYPQGAFRLQVPELRLDNEEKVAVIGPSITESGKAYLYRVEGTHSVCQMHDTGCKRQGPARSGNPQK